MADEPEDEPTYTTFLRSSRNWKEFANNPKEAVDTGLSFSEARESCTTYNKDRSATEIENGTMLEFTKDEDFDG